MRIIRDPVDRFARWRHPGNAKGVIRDRYERWRLLRSRVCAAAFHAAARTGRRQRAVKHSTGFGITRARCLPSSLLITMLRLKQRASRVCTLRLGLNTFDPGGVCAQHGGLRFSAMKVAERPSLAAFVSYRVMGQSGRVSRFAEVKVSARSKSVWWRACSIAASA